jgi:hypothetical protein
MTSPNVRHRAEMTLLLLDLWEDLDAVAAFAQGRQRPPGLRGTPDWAQQARSELPDESPTEVLSRWASLFADELAIVRAARNSVAHSIDISDQALRSAVHLAGKLLLYARISAAPPGESEQDLVIADPRLARALDVGEQALPS